MWTSVCRRTEDVTRPVLTPWAHIPVAVLVAFNLTWIIIPAQVSWPVMVLLEAGLVNSTCSPEWTNGNSPSITVHRSINLIVRG